jgi:hypothetical protein
MRKRTTAQIRPKRINPPISWALENRIVVPFEILLRLEPQAK